MSLGRRLYNRCALPMSRYHYISLRWLASEPESDITKEVRRVMANPEVNGEPVLLNFAKGEKTKGYSPVYAQSYDRVFGTKKSESPMSSKPSVDSSV